MVGDFNVFKFPQVLDAIRQPCEYYIVVPY